MLLYYWDRCSTCRQVRNLLSGHGINFFERDIFARPLSSDELSELVGRAGDIHVLVSVASPRFRRRGRPLGDYAYDEIFELVLEEPRLLRRPLLVTKVGSVLVGKAAIEDEVTRLSTVL